MQKRELKFEFISNFMGIQQYTVTDIKNHVKHLSGYIDRDICENILSKISGRIIYNRYLAINKLLSSHKIWRLGTDIIGRKIQKLSGESLIEFWKYRYGILIKNRKN